MSPRPSEAKCTVYKLSPTCVGAKSLTLNLDPNESALGLQFVFVYTPARFRKQNGSECLTLRLKPEREE